jgi:hypothetical protein
MLLEIKGGLHGSFVNGVSDDVAVQVRDGSTMRIPAKVTPTITGPGGDLLVGERYSVESKEQP